jgi:glycosyltransferase involved in cell wall biosynthesis
VPVRNSEKTIGMSLNSLVNQSYPNLEIIISDNASTDITLNIINEFSANHSFIKVFSQHSDIGHTANFAFVLEKASGEFFAWNAGDDQKSLDFIMCNYLNLQGNPGVVASASTTFYEGSSSVSTSDFPRPLLGSLAHRYKAFFSQAFSSHGLFYSLIRTNVLKKCDFVPKIFYGWDWAIVLFIATSGEISKCDQGFTALGRYGISKSGRENVYRIHNVVGFKKRIPYFDLSIELVKFLRPIALRYKFFIFYLIAILNLKDILLQFPFAVRILKKYKNKGIR